MIASLLASLWSRLSGILAPILMPVLVGLLALCAGGWVWQTARIDGFHVWPIKIVGLRKERDDALATVASVKQAQVVSAQKAQQALAATEASYKAQAEQKDQEYHAEMDSARALAARYVASHRVQPGAAQGAASGTVAAAQGDGAGVREDLPADSVLVGPNDVQNCTDATVYAVKLREWALGLDSVK